MACWTLKDLFGHLGHEVMIRYYGDIKNPVSVTLECLDCQDIVLEFHESSNGTLHLGPVDQPHEIHVKGVKREHLPVRSSPVRHKPVHQSVRGGKRKGSRRTG
jgi:hypothetical protein